MKAENVVEAAQNQQKKNMSPVRFRLPSHATDAAEDVCFACPPTIFAVYFRQPAAPCHIYAINDG